MLGPLTEARATALARIGLGLACLVNVQEMHVLLTRIAGGGLAMPVLDGLPAPSTWSVWLVTALGAVAGLALVVGWRPGPAALALTGLSLGIFLWDQQTYSNHRFLALVLVLLLALARSDRAWALRRSGAPAPPPWPRFLMMTQLSVCYLFAGLSKINPVFPGGRQFDTWLRVDLPATLDMSMALGTILGEVFIALGLWFARTRTLAVVLGVLLHVSIVVGMAHGTLPLVAFTLTCVPLYPLFFLRPGVGSAATDVPSSSDELTSGAAR